ncbi:MAG: S26 family signal peptidase, partial [Flavobacteriaceae bacterium]|nr:S26 family signal peptidase [Flavobacteriaceae bacterium]
ESLSRFKNNPNVAEIIPIKQEEGARDPRIFPEDERYNWNNDFFGPLYIPEEGKTIDLNVDVLPLYKQVITEYEGNDLRVEGSDIYINGKLANSYTFKQDYYWMKGDNRHNSLDSRVWGFVPFNHVVGKPVFIWMSWDGLKNPRWERFFTTVSGEGKAISFFIPFLILLLIIYVFRKWRQRQRATSK